MGECSVPVTRKAATDLVGNLVFLELILFLPEAHLEPKRVVKTQPRCPQLASPHPGEEEQVGTSLRSPLPRPSRTGGSTTEHPGRASLLQHRSEDTGSCLVAGGPRWGLREGPRHVLWVSKGALRRQGSLRSTKKAPAGGVFSPDGDDGAYCRLLAQLGFTANPESKRKNKLVCLEKSVSLFLGAQHRTYACFRNGSELA